MTNLEFMRETLAGIKMFDVHTHIKATNPSARGLHDILLYHMVISDLYSAGCPSGNRLVDDAGEEEIERRIVEAIPYIKYIQNTSCYYVMNIILKELYDWDQPITLENWRELDGIIKGFGCDKERAYEVMDKAGIMKSNTEICRRFDGSLDDRFTYSLEWSFFTRAQWGVYDTALFELEYAYNCDGPRDPLPVTCKQSDYNFEKKINSIDDVKLAIAHYIDKTPFETNLIFVTSHITTVIKWRLGVTDEEMAQAIQNRATAGEYERDVYACYIFEKFLDEYAARGIKTPLAFSIGAEPLPYETGSIMREETILEIAGIIEKYPSIMFCFSVSNMAQNQAFCTLCRELPNVALTGYWWHNFFVSFIEKVLCERLDMVAANKQVGFFSDAYCMEWAYAKARLVRETTAKVLADRIDAGMYTRESAAFIAEQILRDGPLKLVGLE